MSTFIVTINSFTALYVVVLHINMQVVPTFFLFNCFKDCILTAVAWRGLALLALLGPDWGVGGLWVSGPRARSALVWSTAGGACGLAATAPWGVYTVAVGGHTFGLSSALFWVEAAVVPAVVLLGVPCPGGPPDVWGPDLFHACFMPCGMGLLFPTHTIKHLHGGTL